MVTEMTNDECGLVEMWKQQEQKRKIEDQEAGEIESLINKELQEAGEWYAQARSLCCRRRDRSKEDRLRIRMCYVGRMYEAYRKYLGDETEKV
ncbi:MAG: hypothetical protein NTW67_06720 [Candidatus Woesearchaeota archaeon]|nr:hypothetical protein [Candidatus Woesearchaeota archaeon]